MPIEMLNLVSVTKYSKNKMELLRQPFRSSNGGKFFVGRHENRPLTIYTEITDLFKYDNDTLAMNS